MYPCSSSHQRSADIYPSQFVFLYSIEQQRSEQGQRNEKVVEYHRDIVFLSNSMIDTRMYTKNNN